MEDEKKEKREYLVDNRSTEELLLDMTLEKINEEAIRQKNKILNEIRLFVPSEDNDNDNGLDDRKNIEILKNLCQKWLKLDALSEMATYKYFDEIKTNLSSKIYHFAENSRF